MSLTRYLGCLLGGALGDALGLPVEFAEGDEVDSILGSNPPARLLRASNGKALVSDDTQMTLFTAEGLIRAQQRLTDRGICSPPAVIFHAYQRWLETQMLDLEPLNSEWAGWLVGVKELRVRRAPGNTSLSALIATRSTGPRDITSPPNDSKGCGAIMRSAPIGLVARSPEIAFELARDAAVTTHGHPSGYLAAAYFAVLIHGVSRGAPLDKAMSTALALLDRADGSDEVRTAVVHATRRASSPSGVPRDDIESLGGGWVAEEALAIAIYSTLTAKKNDVAGALYRSVAHDGDSDSTGSLTGNLLGAMYGAKSLPSKWLADLELREEIETIARDLYASCAEDRALDKKRYPPN